MKKKIYIALVVDKSGSLREKAALIIKSLNDMVDNIKNGPELSGCDIYFTLVTFTEHVYPEIVCCPIDKIDRSKLELRFGGQTNPAPALRFAIGNAINKTHEWAYSSEEYFKPLVFFMTDGRPEPDKFAEDYDKAVQEFHSVIYDPRTKKNRCTIVGAGYGRADMERIRSLTGDLSIQIENNDKSLAAFFSDVVPKTIAEYSTGEAEQFARNFGKNIAGSV